MAQNEKLFKLLEEAAKQYRRLNTQQQAFAVKELQRIRNELISLLTEYAGADGSVKKDRLMALIRELDALEKMTMETFMDVMRDVIDETAEYSTRSHLNALQAAGVAATAAVAADFTGTFNRISANVARYVFTRFEGDGLVLSDRIWRVTKEQREEIEKVIRTSILIGESVNKTIRKVRQVYDTETWKIRRLVVTEGNTAYRVASIYTAQQSPNVRAVRIHRGRANNPRHRCTVLENTDRYGLGKGIYLPNDPEVYNPHPNCTSFLTYVLTDDAGGGANARY